MDNQQKKYELWDLNIIRAVSMYLGVLLSFAIKTWWILIMVVFLILIIRVLYDIIRLDYEEFEEEIKD